MPQDYNDTLNLPKTDFPMRASLPVREPEMLHTWERNRLYDNLMRKNEGKPLYILHDGPPYANGDIHMGTALNKALKDFIVRYKNMAGFKAPYVPGWDTHGLPTELKARKETGVENTSAIDPLELRAICRNHAMQYLDGQRTQFKRLGVLGEWDNPYITLVPEFEATQIEIFCELACNGQIYKGLKPVYWCPDCKTALAEAEIEYAEDPCNSVFVKFKVTDDQGKLTALGADPDQTYFVIWTTTNWTLPGNVAICVGPSFTYALIRAGEQTLVVAEDLAASVMEAAGIADYKILATVNGSDLEYIQTTHPFLDRKSLVIVGDHVTLESGTGCVHTAPGHGVDDFLVCQNYPELEIIVPVDAAGKLNELAGLFAGMYYQKANKTIETHLNQIGALLATQAITHQYPHCWRCKKPVLFRATEQWFCSVDSMKEKAVQAIRDVQWLPAWGEDRMTAMVTERSDWCISRQRKWGVPIPIFYCNDCQKPLMTRESILAVAERFRNEGSDAWYKYSAEEILPAKTKCDCGGKQFTKEEDIMDVWFDSGVSHAAVLEKRGYLRWPADLYLEGADQYRGWFQSSLLTSVAWRGTAPYQTVVSHGWVVDGEGRKMSKSLGNGMEPAEVVNYYGADVLRLWAASCDYHSDIRISNELLKQLSEAYRKIRNTARYILGNLHDFNPDIDCLPVDQLQPIDQWALLKLSALQQKAKQGYDAFEFHQIFHAVHHFCVVDMSNFYLDVIKDRLYVEQAQSKTRRAAQSAMFTILNAMTKIIAPVLAFTAEEIWNAMPHRAADDKRSVLYNEMFEPMQTADTPALLADWDRLHEIRNDVSKALELAREQKQIGKSLEAKVVLNAEGALYDFLKANEASLAELFIVSQVQIDAGGAEGYKGDVEGLTVQVLDAQGQKCERCWMYSESVGQHQTHADVCARCAKIMEEITTQEA